MGIKMRQGRGPWGPILYGILALAVVVAIGLTPTPAQAQLGGQWLNWPQPNPVPLELDSDTPVGAGCVRLDGYCLLRVAAPKPELNRRIRTIEAALHQVRRLYLQTPDSDWADSTPPIFLEVRQPPPLESSDTPAPESTGSSDPPSERRTPEIYLGVDPRQMVRLMSVTRFDAALKGVDVTTAAEILSEQVEAGFQQAHWERQSPYVLTQLGWTLVLSLGLVALHWGLSRWEGQLRRAKERLRDSITEQSASLSNLLDERQRWNLTEAQHRLSQLARALFWIGGGLFILSRFPQTRILQVQVVQALHIPLRLLPIALGVYIAIRLSFALINHLAAIIANSYEISIEGDRRMQLRVRTISHVSLGMVSLIWLGVGGVVALSSLGVNIAPLLAGAGLIGVALSLPAQSLIKDGINGFFIIFEDQYAVGDVITVHGIRGLVEKINLRITQIRDEEGCLVTIPNSEIGVIANHSSRWSQADIYIPISYTTDVDQVLALIETVGQAMQGSDRWRQTMLAIPEVLGVENFDERGLTIRVWIKTQPLKQWEVAREYRRRLKVALDAAGIVIPAHIDFKAPLESSSG